jgi:hypothetical protein
MVSEDDKTQKNILFIFDLKKKQIHITDFIIDPNHNYSRFIGNKLKHYFNYYLQQNISWLDVSLYYSCLFKNVIIYDERKEIYYNYFKKDDETDLDFYNRLKTYDKNNEKNKNENLKNDKKFISFGQIHLKNNNLIENSIIIDNQMGENNISNLNYFNNPLTILK